MPSFRETHPPGVTIAIDPAFIRELQSISAELRHVYENLINGYVSQDRMKEFADGLLSPQIKNLERLTRLCEGKLP